MNRIYAIFLGAALFAIAPNYAYAAGSGGNSSSNEPSMQENYKDAVRAVEAQEYRKAIALLNKVIDEKPRHPDALNYLGYSHRKLGDYARGVTYYQKALSLEPDHRGANEYLGQAYVELGNLAGAESQLQSLAKICGMDCDEYKSLKQALDAAKAQKAKQG
jgi:predicted Zn-dependent protease